MKGGTGWMARDDMARGFPDGFIVRPPTLDDAAAVADLIQACDLLDAGESAVSAEGTRALVHVRTCWSTLGEALQTDY
jgi:hypothetical protein